MVKGNWERRAELASLRRANDKIAKAERKAGSRKITTEAASNKLLSDNSLIDAVIYAWLKDDSFNDETASVCSAHIRSFEGCPLKRCKLIHPAVTVGHLRGLVTENTKDDPAEVILMEPISLRLLRSADFPRIRYISVDGRCVFDWSNAELWRVYAAELDLQRATMKVCEAVLELSVGESFLDTGVDADKIQKDLQTNAVNVTARPSALQRLIQQCHDAITSCFSYLSLKDLICVSSCSTVLRQDLHNVPELRRRIQKGKSNVAASEARKKADQKRKRQIQAHIGNSDKVDAFARGGRSGG